MSHPKLNPEIVAYWEKQGYTIVPRRPDIEEYSIMVWDAVRDGVIADRSIAFTFQNLAPTQYYVLGECPNGGYSEVEMLAIVRGLAAFI